MFFDTNVGACASADFYSLIETAKTNGIEPYARLRTVFIDLPPTTSWSWFLIALDKEPRPDPQIQVLIG